jgi:hypothetical protein
MSELINNIVNTLIDDETFVNDCKRELTEIMKDGKFDFKDMPEVIALVVLVYEKYDELHVEEKDIIDVFRLLIVELLKKLNFIQESNDEVNKMIESCLKLLSIQVKSKSFWKKYFGWWVCKCCVKCKC